MGCYKILRTSFTVTHMLTLTTFESVKSYTILGNLRLHFMTWKLDFVLRYRQEIDSVLLTVNNGNTNGGLQRLRWTTLYSTNS